jgi:RNA polymerase sigma factor (sigma-70 family)
MEPASDGELLQHYARERSEAAFAELVRRHIDWVYSSAVRQTRDPHLAEDITQSVFILLARKAKTFDRNVVLGAWLFRALRYLAADAMKTKWRRRHHEKEFGAIMNRAQETSPEWNEIAAALDGAVAGLRTTDRRAILLRFFERKSHEEIGRLLGISEEAAKMRVSRAVEKLRVSLGRRGVALPATAIVTALGAHAVTPAPAALASSSVAGAMGTSAAPLVSLPWIKGALLAMSTAKQASIIIVTAFAILLAGGVTVTLMRSTQPKALAATNAKPRPSPEGVNTPDAMRRLYALSDGEIVKRVPPPFIDEREPYMTKMTLGDNIKIKDPNGTSLVFKWQPKEADPLGVWSFRLGEPDLQFVMWGILDAREGDVDAPEKLLRHRLDGDWVFAPEAKPAQRAAALRELLKTQFGLNLSMEWKKTPLEVISISGELVPPKQPVQIYSDKMTDNKPGPGEKRDLAGLASELRLILRVRVLNESATNPKTPLSTCLHTSALLGAMPPARRNAKIDMILANVSRQTGLTLRREVRPVDAWVVRELGGGT